LYHSICDKTFTLVEIIDLVKAYSELIAVQQFWRISLPFFQTVYSFISDEQAAYKPQLIGRRKISHLL